MKPLEIEDFGQRISGQGTPLIFGLDRNRVAGALRYLAERIEADETLPSKVELNGIAYTQDWVTRTLIITYFDRQNTT